MNATVETNQSVRYPTTSIEIRDLTCLPIGHGPKYKCCSDPAAGTSDDWAHGKLNIPWSFGVEVGPQRTGFNPPEGNLNNIGREMFAAVETVARKVIEKRRHLRRIRT